MITLLPNKDQIVIRKPLKRGQKGVRKLTNSDREIGLKVTRNGTESDKKWPNSDQKKLTQKLTQIAKISDQNVIKWFLISDFDAFEHYRSSLIFKVITGSVFLGRITFGTFFYVFLIHFERYGGDPKKRSLKNRILSLTGIFILLDAFSARIINAWSILIGPINPFFGFLCMLVESFVGVTVILCLTELIIFQNLMLFKFSQISILNEDFCSNFITMTNLGFAGISQLTLFWIDGLPVKPIEFRTGKIKISSIKPKFWLLMSLIPSLIMIVGSIVSSTKKGISWDNFDYKARCTVR